jgi:hypothetical protein
MTNLTIKFLPECDNPCCGLCGNAIVAGAGPQPFLNDEPVCRKCANRHNARVVALVDLAHVAERVGKVCRHMLVPPMEALLALARAAEDFTQSAPETAPKARLRAAA